MSVAALGGGCAWLADIEEVTYRPLDVDGGGASPRDSSGSSGDVGSSDSGDAPFDGGADAPFDGACDPNVGFITTVPPPGKDGDWNCDGVVTKQFPSFVTCVDASAASCNQLQGFFDDPGCGEEGQFATCSLVSTTCVPFQAGERLQGCR